MKACGAREYEIDMPPMRRLGSRAVRIVLDAREDQNGRALFAISALHLCAGSLPDAVILALCPTGAVVKVALEAFEWDTGIRVQIVEADCVEKAFVDADLYVSVSLNAVHSVWFEQANRAGVRALVATQFPGVDDAQVSTTPARAAHDTRVLSEQVLECLESCQ